MQDGIEKFGYPFWIPFIAALNVWDSIFSIPYVGQDIGDALSWIETHAASIAPFPYARNSIPFF